MNPTQCTECPAGHATLSGGATSSSACYPCALNQIRKEETLADGTIEITCRTCTDGYVGDWPDNSLSEGGSEGGQSSSSQNPGTECIPKQCVCNNGRAASGTDCPSYGG